MKDPKVFNHWLRLVIESLYEHFKLKYQDELQAGGRDDVASAERAEAYSESVDACQDWLLKLLSQRPPQERTCDVAMGLLREACAKKDIPGAPMEDPEVFSHWLQLVIERLQKHFKLKHQDELQAGGRDNAASGERAEAHSEEETMDPIAHTRGVTVVSTAEEASNVLKVLKSLTEEDRYHAIDTEVKGWLPKLTPYGHGEVTCFSIYCGDDVDFGTGPRLWVDNMGMDGESRGLVECFREYFEDPSLKKVFQNYSFDRAMLFNEGGVRVAGFAGDTMIMARLEHSDRMSYSLESLGCELLGDPWGKQSLSNLIKREGVKRADELHTSANVETRKAWMDYSTFDTVATWTLHQELLKRLREMPWEGPEKGKSMLDFYETYWRPFAEVLVGMEERGVPADKHHFAIQEIQAEKDYEAEIDAFRDWVRAEYQTRYPDDADLAKDFQRFNPMSSKQLAHLLFGADKKVVSGICVGGLGLSEELVKKRSQKTGAISLGSAFLEELSGREPHTGKEGCGSALPYLGAQGCMGLSHLIRAATIEKALNSFLKPLQERVDDAGRVHTSLNIKTTTGRLTASNPNLQQLPALEKDPYEVRRGIACPEGMRFIIADYGQLDLRVLAHQTKCSKMIEALRSGVDIHSVAAFNMYAHVREAVKREAARLRQEAIERGEMVPEASKCSEGVELVKDLFPTERRFAKTVNFGIAYGLTPVGLAGQLNCPRSKAEEMINSWYEAYPEVKQWKFDTVKEASSQHIPYVVTLGGRRRILKALKCNNSVGKGRRPATMATAQDWKKRQAFESACRQATNSPVQGGSADIVVEAMLKADRDERLRTLGYAMVLQVHDELIFEGPAEAAQEALEVVREIMERPFLDGSELLVPLPVDAKVAKNWHEGKGGGPVQEEDEEELHLGQEQVLDEA